MITKRNIAMCIVFSIITCGIYGIYWFIKLTDETNTIAVNEKTASGGMAVVFTIITCGIYSWYWMYKQGSKIDEAKTQRGIQSSNSGILYLILGVIGLGIVSYALMQDELNKLA